MKVSVIVLQVAFLVQAGPVVSQTVEDLLEQQSDAADASELAELIVELREHPVDLNRADRDDLDRIPFLSGSLITGILNYRKGKAFTRLEELLSVDGMTGDLFEAIEDFVTVKPIRTRPTMFSVRSRVSDRLEKPAGFQDGTYAGSRSKIYNRAKFVYGKLSGGLLLEKDSGEKALDDLRLWNFTLALNQKITVVAGSFFVQSGQGLVFWGPYGFSKGASTLHALRRRAGALKPYLTVDENLGLQGGAVSAKYRKWQFLGFVSHKERDVSLNDDGNVSGFSATGLHRTESERSRKDFVAEESAGGAVRYRMGETISIGSNWVLSRLEKPIEPTDPERQFYAFAGRSNWNASIDFNLHAKRLSVFGEYAISRRLGKGALLGVIFDRKRISLALVLRSYDPRFQTFRGLGFGERNGQTQNERGYYCGLQYGISRKTTVQGYYDIYRFPWRTYQIHLPAQGHEAFLQLKHRLAQGTHLVLRFKQERREVTSTVGDLSGRTSRLLEEKVTRRWRIEIDYRVSQTLRTTSRVDGCSMHLGGTRDRGVSLSQRLTLRLWKRMRIASGFAVFGSDSFGSALYQYEYDVTGVMSNKALFGRGQRWYVVFKYYLTSGKILELKYAETYREDVDSLGSGADTVDQPRDRRFTLQLNL